MNYSKGDSATGGLVFVGAVGFIFLDTKAQLDQAPGADLTQDARFTIADVATGSLNAFAAPARWLLGLLGKDVLTFLDIGHPEPSLWIAVPLAIVAWLAMLLVVTFVLDLGLSFVGAGFRALHSVIMHAKWKPTTWVAGDIRFAMAIAGMCAVAGFAILGEVLAR